VERFSTSYLDKRPDFELTQETINHLAANPCDGMESYLALSWEKHIEHCGSNKSTISQAQRRIEEEIELKRNNETELMEKEPFLQDTRQRHIELHDQLVVAETRIHELKNTIQLRTRNIEILTKNKKNATFLLEVSQLIVKTPIDQRPFASRSLADIRVMMKVPTTAEVIKLSQQGTYQKICLCYNFGLQANPEFIGLWQEQGFESDKQYEDWTYEYGERPKIHTGKIADVQKMKNRIACALISLSQEMMSPLKPSILSQRRSWEPSKKHQRKNFYL
jgi:hypothetical protein